MPPMLQPKHVVFTSNDDPMQIDKTRFKPLIEHEKQCQRINNFCLYCGKLGHIASVCPNKRVQHATCTTTPTIIQGLEEEGNEDVKFQ
jgi:6-phosphogluconolactonase/glucosamine-6-phosphate isomerase/deaminase